MEDGFFLLVDDDSGFKYDAPGLSFRNCIETKVDSTEQAWTVLDPGPDDESLPPIVEYFRKVCVKPRTSVPRVSPYLENYVLPCYLSLCLPCLIAS